MCQAQSCKWLGGSRERERERETSRIEVLRIGQHAPEHGKKEAYTDDEPEGFDTMNKSESYGETEHAIGIESIDGHRTSYLLQ
jgi:hypothetical protein